MSEDNTAAFRPCATCGGDLRKSEPLDGLIFTIRDNRGEHHSACWGKQDRDAIAAARNAALEEAAKVADSFPAMSDALEEQGHAIAAAIREMKGQ